MEPNVVVWDLETVPDLAGFAAANDLVGQVRISPAFKSGEIAMYVDMKIEERKVNAVGQGWLSPLLGLYKVPVHSLIVSITFSESEKAAIKARKLEAERIINKPYIFTDALASRGVYLHRSISLSSFLRGPVTIDYRVLWEAQEAMRKLEENLNALKANLSRPDAPTPMTRRFEI